jgi:uncharacterized protein (TIGR02145 family)
MGVLNGQFFAPIEQQLEITATYFDGMFLSFVFPADLQNIVFSIFLSQKINPSVNYTGTKTRYMGCFTTKTFLSLTDTPSTYAGQANKVATVKADETGLEFKTPSSGGLQCADLPNCPSIISMLSTDNLIINYLIAAGFLPSSCIPLNYGALYNIKAISSQQFCPPGWRIPTYYDYAEASTYLGGNSVSGGKLKEIGLTHWLSPNLGATDLVGFKAIPAGFRANAGIFTSFGSLADFWTLTTSGSTNSWFMQLDTNLANMSLSAADNRYGLSVRLIKNDSLNPNTLTDIDGNIYPTIKFGNQVWLGSNYKCTRLTTGVLIPNITDSATFWASITPALCYPNNYFFNR